VAGTLAATIVGFIASRLHLSGLAPVGLLSIAVGCALGATLGWLGKFNAVHCRTRLILGTLMLSLMTVLAQHAWLYLDFRRQWHAARANSAEVALFRPETPWSPAEYFTREASAGRVALWVMDAALIVAAAMVTAVVLRRAIGKQHVASDGPSNIS
jgi:hypothetical protein